MTREEAIRRVEGYLHADGYSDTKEIIKALEQKPYEKFENVKDHIYKLAGDYKCWDNRLTQDEALELCHILEQKPCEDAVSRQAVEKITWEEPSYSDALNVLTEVRDKVRALPSVTKAEMEGEE